LTLLSLNLVDLYMIYIIFWVLCFKYFNWVWYSDSREINKKKQIVKASLVKS